MLDQMNPVVVKKAIEQFPNFSSTMKEILHHYKESLDKAHEANAQSVKSVYDSCNMVISSLQKELEKNGLNFKEKSASLIKWWK